MAIVVATHKPYRMPEDACYLPLQVMVTVGKNTFACTTTLVPEGDGCRAYLSFAPNAKKKFKGEVRVVEVVAQYIRPVYLL